MINNLKINSLFLPLLLSILLTTSSTLAVGGKISSFLHFALTPITSPTALLHNSLYSGLEFLANFPSINTENIMLKKENAMLLRENYNLKDAISDQSILQQIKTSYTTTIPIRIIGTGKIITATTTLPTNSIKQGQPVVLGSILLGFVDRVDSSLIYINSLDSGNLIRFPVKTGSNQTGVFYFENRLSQIADLPSENPIILNDTVLTLPTSLIPPNLVVGKITKIISTPQSPLQKAEVDLDTKISMNISGLVIITKP